MNKEYHQYTTSIPSAYHEYTTSIRSVYHGIRSVYHGIRSVYHQYTTSIPQWPLQVWIRDFVVTWWCNETFFNFSLKIALRCIALHCIVQSEVHFNLKLTALRSMRVQWICFFLCSVWNAFQLKPDSSEIYENSVFVFQLVCISVCHYGVHFIVKSKKKEAQDEIKYI